ncbi:MAG: ABC-type transport auxiliary lipoprotein family protein [Acidobacteria bacterium]|nr:ABC-type transport auxiliary lipoprotein family protein [Acidobacteriota bacterium]
MKTAASQLKGWTDKIRYGRAISSAMLFAVICSGCASVPKTHYYTLRTPALPPAPQVKTDFVLQVEPFDAPEMLRDDRIVYYSSPVELNFHDYHRWSSNPAALLSDLAVKYFAETGLFKEVYLYPAPVEADYTLQGRVLDFAQMDYEKSRNGKRGKGRVSLALDLVRTRDNAVVWSTRREDEVAIEKKGMASVVDALNTASQQLLGDAFSGIAGVVGREFAQKQGQSH